MWKREVSLFYVAPEGSTRSREQLEEAYSHSSGITGFLLWRNSPNLPVFKQKSLLSGGRSLA